MTQYLNTERVAEILCISKESARKFMREMPHAFPRQLWWQYRHSDGRHCRSYLCCACNRRGGASGFYRHRHPCCGGAVPERQH